MQELVTLILAEDSDTGMKSSVAAAAHKVCGKPLLSYIIDAAVQVESESLVVISDRKDDEIRKLAPEDAIYIEHQTGTANILIQIQEILKNRKGSVLILNGNTPAITGETLRTAYDYHKKNNNQVTVLTAADQKFIQKINSNIYFFNNESLLMMLSQLDNTSHQEYNFSEFFKNVIMGIQKVDTYQVENPDELIAVHGRTQPNEVERIILKRIISKHMQNGVTFHLPETCMIHAGVKIGKDTVIHPGTILEGETVIGENCEIGPNSRIEDGEVGDGVYFINSVMTQSQVGNNTKVGPFAYIRPGSKIGQNIKIGDFVEIKNSAIGDGTKVPHLTYVGDADVGRGVNFGCGSVVVNYDGKIKHRTVVGDHAFIGCNTNLVSPVVIRDYAYTAAGSTITDEVPEYALAIARSRQTVIENWVKKKGLDKK